MRYSGKQFLGQSDFFMIKSGFPFFYSKVPDKQANRNKQSIKGQLNSEWIYEVNISPKMQTKNQKKCYNPCLFGRAEILKNFGLHFGRNVDLINSFWV